MKDLFLKELFLNVVEISISTSFIILALLACSSYLDKRYAVKWKYLIWIAIAVRLVLPFNFRLPEQQIVVDIPTQITTPINVNVGTAVPLVLRGKPKMTQITPLDIAACLWLAGCLLFLSVHLFSFLRFRKQIVRYGEAVEDGETLQHICRLSGELRIKPNIQVLRYSDAGSPMVIGFFKPLLVLPACEYNGEELFFVLKHELVHLRRHDIYFKLLFVVANALHWFNPLVYVMQKEAVVDMELSCDERVVQQTPYAVRKAYTETLFSTISRQHKKETTLTTQFYGGKKVMKKRFQNILARSEKRNGAVLSVCAVCLTLASGMLVGCSVAGDIASGMQAQTRVEADQSDAVTKKAPSDAAEKSPFDAATENPQDIPADTNPQDGQIITGVDSNDGETVAITLSADSEQIRNMVEEFAAAYFSGDASAVKSLLPDSYTWDVEAYEGTGTISDIAVLGLPDAGEQAIGGVWTVSMQYRDSTYEDMFQYLTIELVKQSAGWEIQFYGIEG